MSQKAKQLQRVAAMLCRFRGATAMELAAGVPTVCPHKRMSDLKAAGWTITRKQVPDANYGRYFGKAPKVVKS